MFTGNVLLVLKRLTRGGEPRNPREKLGGSVDLHFNRRVFHGRLKNLSQNGLLMET